MVLNSAIGFFICLALSFLCYKEARHNYSLLQKWPGCSGGPVIENAQNLSGSCSKYSSKSCCNSTISNQIGEHINHKDMRFDFCGTDLSPSCKSFFDKHFCLEACDPYMMPYHNSIRDNKYQVPLCESVCKNWHSACLQEMFCSRNLIIQYVWKFNRTYNKIVNNCYQGADCKPVNRIYHDHIDFCETIFNGFYKILSDDDCVVFDFKSEANNPNSSLHKPGVIFFLLITLLLILFPLMSYQLYSITQSSF